jgi:hypothetical protein
MRGVHPAHTVRPPHQVGRATVVLRINARDGREPVTLEVAPASDGGSCMIVRSEQTPTNRACSIPTPKPREIAAAPMQFGGAPGGIQLLVGPVGEETERLIVRCQDGRERQMPLRDGWTLYEVAPADYTRGRRPKELIGHDAASRVIATERLPWAAP